METPPYTYLCNMGSHYVMLRGSDSAGSSSGSWQHEMRSVLLPYTGWHPRIHSTQTKHQVHTYVRTYVRTYSVRSSCSFIHSVLSLASLKMSVVYWSGRLPCLSSCNPRYPIAILACRETRQGPLQVWDQDLIMTLILPITCRRTCRHWPL